SCAKDMARWLQIQLVNGALPEGGRLFSEETSNELWTVVTPYKPAQFFGEFEAVSPQFGGYGLGFSIEDYRGRKQVGHNGGMPGFLSRVSMIPSLKLGIAVLTNQESAAAYDSIIYYLQDYFCGVKPTDWIGVEVGYGAGEHPAPKP